MTEPSHTALARRYRPKSFADVSTQGHVSDTLRGAVAGGRVGHAYLFCGPRGVGKTTVARVLAMALNCPNRTDQGEPCGSCESCERIWSGHTSLDVIEIDAASNRGVDDARSLRERAMYAPSAEDRYKVYIVDEAHMLTREAWNALLKIIEEPPPRVIFVFATTEPQKIQQTAAPILSRCQRFDFRSIGTKDIVARLEQILSSEGVLGAPDAVRALARRADGGMRDALSLTDQVLSLTGGGLTLDAVRSVLGLVEEERYLELFGILSAGRHAEIFRVVESLAADGYDLVEFYHGLVGALRMLLRLRLGEEGEGLDVPEHLREAFRTCAASFAAGDLVRMLSMAADLEATGNLRRTPNPRVLIEMLLLRMSYLERTVRVEELLGSLGGAARQPEAPSPPTPERPARPHGTGPGVPGSERTGRGPGAASAVDPVEAWRTYVEAGEGVPPGLGPFLRSATVRPGTDGSLVVELPDGPGFERMSKPAVKAAVSAGLAVHLDGAPVLEVRKRGEPDSGNDPAGPNRVTQTTVRETRLQELIEQEPLLERAVEELDLELLDP